MAEKDCKKTEKCRENYVGNNVSDFVSRLKVTLLFVDGSIPASLDSAKNDHSNRILI